MGGSFRFIHCADLHLGGSVYGISSENMENGDRIRKAVMGALDRIVDKAKECKADFVIFAGDIFDNSNETPLTRSTFAEAIRRLRVPCFIAYGNHDYKRRWEKSIPLPKNAFVFPEKTVKLQFTKGGEPVASICGASFPSRHSDADMTESASGTDGLFSIGVYHCNIDAVSEDDRYATCRKSVLLSKNIDYWAMGHIHKRTIVSESPYIVYPGNTQGRYQKESGEKGAYVVTVTDGRVSSMEFFRTGEILWSDVTADITGRQDMSEVIDSVETEEGSFVRIRFTGRGELDRMLRLDPTGLKELIEQRKGCRVMKLTVDTYPDIDLDARAETGDFISAVINVGRTVGSLPREEIIDMICSTTTAKTQRAFFEKYSDDELRDIVKDSIMMLIERLTEARQ